MGWFTKTYGGKNKYDSPATQDTGRHFGRGSAKPTKGCYPPGKPRWA